jgi:hypothetical protein
MLNSFSVNPENDCYQQRRSKNNNEKEPIFFLHGITGGRHFITSEITCMPAGVPNSGGDKSLTATGQKMDIYRKLL